jgi:hypothetical protein
MGRSGTMEKIQPSRIRRSKKEREGTTMNTQQNNDKKLLSLEAKPRGLCPKPV